MKRRTLTNFMDLGHVLGRQEMKKIMAGCAGDCTGDWCVCWTCGSGCFECNATCLCPDGSNPTCCNNCNCTTQ